MKAKYFRLPDELGSGILSGQYVESVDGLLVHFKLKGGGLVELPASRVAETEPPFPSEPPAGAYRIVGGDHDGKLTINDGDHTDNWLLVEDWHNWRDFWREIEGPDVKLVRLVQDPFDVPVELPLHVVVPGRNITVDSTLSGQSALFTVKDTSFQASTPQLRTVLPPNEARRIACALWASVEDKKTA